MLMSIILVFLNIRNRFISFLVMEMLISCSLTTLKIKKDSKDCISGLLWNSLQSSQRKMPTEGFKAY